MKELHTMFKINISYEKTSLTKYYFFNNIFIHHKLKQITDDARTIKYNPKLITTSKRAFWSTNNYTHTVVSIYGSLQETSVSSTAKGRRIAHINQQQKSQIHKLQIRKYETYNIYRKNEMHMYQ